jgi:biopolymer transport protein ExbB
MIDILTRYLEQFASLMDTGGAAMWILFFLNLLLWYSLGHRYFTLRRQSVHNVRRLVTKHIREGDKRKRRGILDHAIVDALKAASEARAIGKKPRRHVYDALFPYQRRIKEYSVAVNTVVMMAPLIGLLGTVIGMIETFDALQSSAMFSQGASISGGISKALYTTELGLIVAVPGLIIGRRLETKERGFAMEFMQLTNIVCAEGSTDAP